MATLKQGHQVAIASARRPMRSTLPGSRSALHEPRWPMLADVLAELRGKGRRAVRIVDVDCGAGLFLLHALHHARLLGFVAVEGRGIDGSPALIGRARAAALRSADPAIGVEFETADMVLGLQDEFDLPADILVCHGSRSGDRQPTMAEMRRAADHVIADDLAWRRSR